MLTSESTVAGLRRCIEAAGASGRNCAEGDGGEAERRRRNLGCCTQLQADPETSWSGRAYAQGQNRVY